MLGADHKLIGASLQAALRLLGEKAPEIVFFEFVSLPEGSMSTRAGKFIPSDDLIEETRRRAFEEVTVRRPELPEEERTAIARSVALAAIRYDIVRVSPEKATVFDWATALDFERQSGPYVQYAHARACSILAKAGATGARRTRYDSVHEQALARQIAKFPVVVAQTIEELRPHLLATYARELADLFNTFYHFEPVLRAEGATRDCPAHAGEGRAEHAQRGPRDPRDRCPRHHVSRPARPSPGRATSSSTAARPRRSSPASGAAAPSAAARPATSSSSTGSRAHRCVQMTPTLRCNQRCLFCWRSFEHEPTEEVELAPEALLAALPRLQKQALAGYKVHVAPERFDEGADPRHVAVSLAGEPTLYSQLPRFLDLCTDAGMTTFLVTNGTRPWVVARLPAVPDLRLARRAGRGDVPPPSAAPRTPRAWELVRESLALLGSRRSAIRTTLVAGLNDHDPAGYGALVADSAPTFVEVKGYMHLGYSRKRLTAAHMPSHERVRAFARAGGGARRVPGAGRERREPRGRAGAG